TTPACLTAYKDSPGQACRIPFPRDLVAENYVYLHQCLICYFIVNFWPDTAIKNAARKLSSGECNIFLIFTIIF
ncbi:hypothetical protein MJI12_19970, partial [Salmonella enterica subsp. enterica serovar Kentucky]|nr:hypothetical protein [Salmonella enterica subsp. enterica serovar Kentucky]